jgi:hypothetical protein
MELVAVTCVSGGDCWAVGVEGDANKGGTLIERTGQPAA